MPGKSTSSDAAGGSSTTAVLHESLLHQPLGDPEVFQYQLAHLQEHATREHITLQVLPMATEYPVLARLDVIHVELMTSDVYIEDEINVARYREALSILASLALDPNESTALITETINSTR